MQVRNVASMPGGLFIGSTGPTLFHTPVCDVLVKRLAAGESDPQHVHYHVDKYLLVVSGRVVVNDVTLVPDDVAILKAGECSGIEALEDAAVVVVRLPSAPEGDKHLC